MKKNLSYVLLFTSLQMLLWVNKTICQENQNIKADCQAAVWFNFDKNANDYSGHTLNGTLGGGATASFNLTIGANAVDYVSIPYTAINGDVDFTVSCWLKFTTLQHTGSSPCNTWFSGARASNDNVIAMEYDDADALIRLTLEDNYYDFTGVTLSAGTWYHVVIMRNNTTATLYLHGLLKGTVTVPNTAINIESGGLIIGQDQDNVGGGYQAEQSLAGMMDNLRIYPCYLSSSAITNLYNEGVGNHINASQPDFSFNIYPNPASDKVDVSFNSNAGIYALEVFDMLGTTVLEKTLMIHPAGPISLDVRNFNSGIYLIRLESIYGWSKQSYFIKR